MQSGSRSLAPSDLRQDLEIASAPGKTQQTAAGFRQRIIVNDFCAAGADLHDQHRKIAEPALDRLGQMEPLVLAALFDHGQG